MIVRKQRELPETTKLNLIPIMDAVFIFIFFLLFSAQFIKIFEIETEAPLVSQVPDESVIEKNPLNLTVKIYESKLEVLTGLNQTVYKSYDVASKGYEKIFKSDLIKLRQKHPKEDHAIIAPQPGTTYDEVIRVLDLTQKLPAQSESFEVEIDGKKVLRSKIFTQIVLEPLDEA